MLALLQARRDWTGADLAERLEVTPRTVRQDISRLRELGYPVTSRPGVAGGYRVAPGSVVPPLLLDDDEAVAVALGLRLAAGDGNGPIAESALAALVKLERLLPSRLRPSVRAVGTAVVSGTSSSPVAVDHLLILADAVNDQRQLHVDYTSHDGNRAERTVEPQRLVHWGSRWYLLAWDVDRSDWRTLRVDRVVPRLPLGRRFTAREDPAGGAAAHVRRGVAVAPWRVRATVRVAASAEHVRRRVPTVVTVEPLPQGCLAHVGSDSPAELAWWLGALDADFEIVDAPEVAQACDRLASRYRKGAGTAPPGNDAG